MLSKFLTATLMKLMKRQMAEVQFGFRKGGATFQAITLLLKHREETE
jgi:hypothetical protein